MFYKIHFKADYFITNTKWCIFAGSTVVEKIVGENISPEAVKNVIKVAKASGKKLPRVNVAISLKGINVTDNKGNDMFEVSIYR